MSQVNVGELLVGIRADNQKLNTALKGGETAINNFATKMAAISQKMTSAGLKMSLAVTTPLILIGKNALTSAQDVVESENLFTVSMSKMADSAREWSNEYAKSVGLNEYNVRKSIGTFNVMFDSMGLGTQKAYEMSKGLTSLAYDMASFYNLDVADAFQKLQAGITGEIEPLKRLGIVVNETAVATYAYTHGIADQGEQLTEQEKIMARYGKIMEATSKAQGDLARTLDSPANQMRIFKEQIQLAMIELGKGLIPVIQQVIKVIKPYIEKFTNADDSTKKFVITLGLILTAAGPVLIFLGNAAKAVGTLNTAFMTLNTTMAGSILVKGGGLLTSFVLAILQTGDSIQRSGYQSEEATKKYALLQEFINKLNSEAAGFVSAGGNEIGKSLREIRDSLIGQPEALEAARIEVDKLTVSYKEGTLSKAELIAKLQDMIKWYSGFKQATLDMGKVMPEVISSTDAAAESIDGLGDESEGSTSEVKSLVKSLWELYNINQSVTEATWDFSDAVAEAEKVMKDKNSTDREQQASIFGVQDALENLQLKYEEARASGKLTIELQNEIANSFIESGLKAMEMGLIGRREFDSMAANLGINQLLISDKLSKLDTSLNQSTLKTQGLKAAIAELQSKDIYINTYHVDWYAQAEFKPGQGNPRAQSGKQTGGEVSRTGFIPDLRIIGVKGEGILHRDLMNAIKTGRTDYMGITARSKEVGSKSSLRQEVIIHVPLSLDGRVVYDIWEKYDLREKARRI